MEEEGLGPFSREFAKNVGNSAGNVRNYIIDHTFFH